MILQGIVFDMDGTLADTEDLHRMAFNDAFRDFNLPWHWDVKKYRTLLSISGGFERIGYYLRQYPELLKDIDHPEEFARRVHRYKSAAYRKRLENTPIHLRSGVKRLLNEALERGICIGIATNSSMDNLERLFSAVAEEIQQTWFKAIVTCDIVPEKKPSPMVFQCALEKMGLEAQYCVAIEDSSNGNKSAYAAGLKTVITSHALTVGSDFSNAAMVVDKLGEAQDPFTLQQGNQRVQGVVDIALLEQLLCTDNEPEKTQQNAGETIKTTEQLQTA